MREGQEKGGEGHGVGRRGNSVDKKVQWLECIYWGGGGVFNVCSVRRRLLRGTGENSSQMKAGGTA